MKKRVLSLILATAMIAGSLIGCGGGSSASSSAPAAEPAAEAAAEPAAEEPAAEAAPAEGETVLKLWCIATESDANRPAYLQAIADYEAAHPGIKIEMAAV